MGTPETQRERERERERERDIEKQASARPAWRKGQN